MTLATALERSTNNLLVLVEVDISQLNEEWVNIGAGIWEVNAEKIYAYVDSTWQNGLTAQDFGYVGSVYEDSRQLVRVATKAELTTQQTSFFYDPDTRSLYVRCTNRDNPLMHVIHLGIISPMSYRDFSISGLNTQVKGRVKTIPGISLKRDPLFFGKLSYEGGSLTVINNDGDFDLYGENNNLFGNEVRIKTGLIDTAYEDWITLLTRNIETVDVTEDDTNYSLIDRRKYLSKRIRYTCTNKNAVEAVQEILDDYLGYTYGSTLYDTTAWAVAVAAAPNVTIRMDQQDADEDEEAITVIEWICLASFGVLTITPDNKFSFVITDTSKGAADTIMTCDVKNKISITYNPQEVITSAKVGYAKNWTTDDYTYYTDSTRETTVFKRYKTYKQQLFETVLPDLSSAQTLADSFLDYVQFTKGVFQVSTGLKYYQVELGDTINIEVKRECLTDMLGQKKCEVIGKSYQMDRMEIVFTLRIIGDYDTILITESGAGGQYFLTTDNKLLIP
jgi:hypothetical protein